MSKPKNPSSIRDFIARNKHKIPGSTFGQVAELDFMSVARTQAACTAIKKALDGIAGLTPDERRRALVTLAGYEMVGAMVGKRDGSG